MPSCTQGLCVGGRQGNRTCGSLGHWAGVSLGSWEQRLVTVATKSFWWRELVRLQSPHCCSAALCSSARGPGGGGLHWREKRELGPCETAQCVKALDPLQSEFGPWTPQGGRRQPTPAGCSLSDLHKRAMAHVHTHSLGCAHLYTRRKDRERKGKQKEERGEE